MKIIVESLFLARAHVVNNQDANFAIISVTESDLNFNEDGKFPHLILKRDDIEEQCSQEVIDMCGPMFTAEDGITVKNFVEEHKDRVDYFLIHCDAGISRSRGVAAALCVAYGFDEKEHFENGTPNPTVRKHVLSAYGIEKPYPEKQPVFCFWCGERIGGMISFRKDPQTDKYECIHSECAVAYDYEKALIQ